MGNVSLRKGGKTHEKVKNAKKMRNRSRVFL